MQSWLANFLGIMGGFLALGMFFDSVATTPATKKKISDFIRRDIKSRTFRNEVFGLIDTAYDVIFSKWFGEKFFSVKYFLRSTVMSLVLFLMFSTWQYVQNSMFYSEVKWTNTQVLLLAFAIFFNCVVDWFSIGLTQTFFSLAKSTKNLGHALVLVATDFIVSINLFSIIFSQFVAFQVLLPTILPGQVTLKSDVMVFKVNNTEDLVAELGMKSISNLYQIMFTTKTTLYPSGSEVTARFGAYSSNPNMKLSDMLSLKSLFSPTFLDSNVRVSTAKMVGFEPKIETWGQVDRKSALWDKLSGNPEGFEEIETSNLQYGWFQLTSDLNMAYSVAYVTVDEVQDGFPNSVTSSKPLKIATTDELDLYLPAMIGAYVKGCKQVIDGKEIWTRIDNQEESNNGCLEVFAAGSADYGTLLRAIVQTNAVESSSALIVLNPFFLTSIAATFLLYATVLALAFTRQIERAAFVKLRLIESVFDKAPLTTIFLALGLSVAIIVSIL
jgi:hypothetical protein